MIYYFTFKRRKL